MSNIKVNNWSKTELDKLLELKHLYPTITSTELANKLNNYYQNGRTSSTVSAKLYKLRKILFDEEMDTVIIKHIREYPTNLQYAFKIAASELNILFKHRLTIKLSGINISGRYYSVIKNKYNVITTGSSEGFSVNVKNSYILKDPKKSGTKPTQHLKPILWLMKEILTLSDKERKELISFLNATK